MLTLRRLLGRRPEREMLADLRRRCAAKGAKLPKGMRLRIDGDRVGIIDATYPATAPLGRNGTAHPLLVEHAIATAMNTRLLRARRSLSTGLGGDTDALTSPWTRLVHPLALRLSLVDLKDRRRGPFDWMAGSSGRIRDFHYQLRDHGTIEFSRIMVTREGDPDAIESIYTFLPLEDGVQRAQFALTTVVPEATAASLQGRPLSRLVEFPHSGDDALDAAVAGLIMERVAVLERATLVTLAPVAWVPWSDPPDRWKDWHREADYRA